MGIHRAVDKLNINWCNKLDKRVCLFRVNLSDYLSVIKVFPGVTYCLCILDYLNILLDHIKHV